MTTRQADPHRAGLILGDHAEAEVWNPVEHPPTPDWVEDNIRLPSDTSANPGPIDVKDRCYLREPLAMLDNPEVVTISLLFDAQAGKTITLQAGLLSRAVIDPAPSMVAGPDQDAMRELRDKVYGMAEASPNIRHFVPHKRFWNERHLDLRTMLAYLAFSGSAQRMRGRTCKYVFCTEVSVWQDDPRLGQSAKLIRARTKAYREYKIFYESTPTDDACAITALYKASDQRKFWVPCPHCGHYQELRFFLHRGGPFAGKGGVAGLTNADGSSRSEEEVRQSAYYVCEKGCRIDSNSKSLMIPAGIWVPKGCKVAIKRCKTHARKTCKDKTTGRATSTCRGDYQGCGCRAELDGKPDRGVRHVGYQISALYAPDKSFGDVAAEYVSAKLSGSLREFFNNWLGLAYSTAHKIPDWKTIGSRLAATHRRGTVPQDAYFLTCGADVQEDRVYWVMRAWGDKRTSWLVDWGMINREKDEEHGDPDSGYIPADLARLNIEVLTPSFPVAGDYRNPWGLREMKTRLMGVDCNYRMFHVHAYVRSHAGSDRVRATRGDRTLDSSVPFRCTLVDKNAQTGKPYEGGLQLWGICSNMWREQLLSLFSGQPNTPGAWHVTDDCLRFGEEYLRQLVNQVPQIETTKSGKRVVNWVTRDKALGEHSWDCEVINLVLAEMVTGGEWDAAHWPKPAAALRPRTEEETAPLLNRRGQTEDFSPGFR